MSRIPSVGKRKLYSLLKNNGIVFHTSRSGKVSTIREKKKEDKKPELVTVATLQRSTRTSDTRDSRYDDETESRRRSGTHTGGGAVPFFFYRVPVNPFSI